MTGWLIDDETLEQMALQHEASPVVFWIPARTCREGVCRNYLGIADNIEAGVHPDSRDAFSAQIRLHGVGVTARYPERTSGPPMLCITHDPDDDTRVVTLSPTKEPWLFRRAVKTLPVRARRRYTEEWAADLAAQSKFRRPWWQFGTLLRARSLARALEAPTLDVLDDATEGPSPTFALRWAPGVAPAWNRDYDGLGLSRGIARLSTTAIFSVPSVALSSMTAGVLAGIQAPLSHLASAALAAGFAVRWIQLSQLWARGPGWAMKRFANRRAIEVEPKEV